MAETRTTSQEIQGEILDAVRKSQEAVVDAIQRWADTVQALTPSIPVPNMPYTDKLPKPEELVAGAYDFAEQMLISQRKFTESWLEATRSQRKFAESWLEATKPLLGAVNGMAAEKGATR